MININLPLNWFNWQIFLTYSPQKSYKMTPLLRVVFIKEKNWNVPLVTCIIGEM